MEFGLLFALHRLMGTEPGHGQQLAGFGVVFFFDNLY